MLIVVAEGAQSVRSRLPHGHPAVPRLERTNAAIETLVGLTRRLMGVLTRAEGAGYPDYLTALSELAPLLSHAVGPGIHLDVEVARTSGPSRGGPDPGDAEPVERMTIADFERVLLHLVFDARDALPREGTIRLAVELRPDTVAVTPYLDGPGPAPEPPSSRSPLEDAVAGAGGRLEVAPAPGARFTLVVPIIGDQGGSIGTTS